MDGQRLGGTVNLTAHLATRAALAHSDPTEAQKRAGNYRHGHVKAHGLDVTIENARGSFRRGVDKSTGKPWQVRMGHHYGYIKRTEGADGDHVDVYLGPHLKSPNVFVIDQKDAETGRFDEHKAFMGFASKQQVENAYHKAFSDGRSADRLGHITKMTADDFRKWLRDGDQTKPIKRASGGRITMAEGGALMSDADVGIGAEATAPKVLSDSDVGIGSPATWGSVAKQAALGVGRGLMETAGALGEAVTGKTVRDSFRAGNAADAAAPDQRRATYEKSLAENPGYGHSMREAAGTEGDNVPRNTLERIASGAGEGASSAVLGGPARVLGNVAIGAIGGAAGRGAAESVPDPYKPIAELAGNVLGGGAAGLTAAGASQLPSAISRAVQPFTREGQQTLAGRVLESRATDANALRASLGNPAQREIVPGSQPTTFQTTGDMGIGALEREAQTKDPALFNQRRADQNTVRLDQLSNLQATGNPAEVSGAVRSQLNNVDQMTQRAVDDALNEAQTRAGALGGTQNQEAYGNSLRTILQDAETEARTHERALWSAVDPQGDLTMNMSPVSRATQAVYGDLSQVAGATLKPVEQQILGIIEQYKPIEPFRELTDLRSLVSSAMREEISTSGRTPTYARLSRLRGGIEQSINGAVENRAAADAANIAAGKIVPEQSLASNIQRQIAEWQSERASGQRAAAGTGEAQSAGSIAVSPASRGPSAPGRGSENAPGDQRLPGNAPGVANFDEAAADRLRAATEATRNRAQTFNAEPMKGVLRRQGQQGPYNLRETAVPAKIFHHGDTGFEDVTRFRQAVGDDAARPILRDYAASSLRESAMTPEGTIDPAKFARWRAQHTEALRGFPEAENAFADAASATRTIGDVAALRRSAMEDAQTGVLGKLMGATDPQDVTKAVGAALTGANSVGEMRRLATLVRGNPAATEGLRKAVADHMMQKLIANAEAATSGKPIIKADQFQSFIKNNEAVLSQVFRPEEIASMKAVAADMQRANRSLSAVKIPGQSNTAQDLTSIKTNAGGQSWMSQLFIDGAAAVGAMALSHNPIVAAGAAGMAQVGNTIRAAGFKKVDDLVTQALLNPDLAKALLAKVPKETPSQAAKILSRRIVALTAAAAARNGEKP